MAHLETCWCAIYLEVDPCAFSVPFTLPALTFSRYRKPSRLRAKSILGRAHGTTDNLLQRDFSTRCLRHIYFPQIALPRWQNLYETTLAWQAVSWGGTKCLDMTH